MAERTDELIVRKGTPLPTAAARAASGRRLATGRRAAGIAQTSSLRGRLDRHCIRKRPLLMRARLLQTLMVMEEEFEQQLARRLAASTWRRYSDATSSPKIDNCSPCGSRPMQNRHVKCKRRQKPCPPATKKPANTSLNQQPLANTSNPLRRGFAEWARNVGFWGLGNHSTSQLSLPFCWPGP